jgi:hypothetical protein
MNPVNIEFAPTARWRSTRSSLPGPVYVLYTYDHILGSGVPRRGRGDGCPNPPDWGDCTSDGWDIAQAG